MKNEQTKINEETGEVLEDGYYCPNPHDCGCSCHTNPPCHHCENHWFEAGMNVYEDEK